MPQVTVYIREEDLEKWKAIPKKAEFVHHAINLEHVQEKIDKHPEANIVETNEHTVVKESFEQFLEDYSKPGTRPPHPIYGYPCCHKEAPCKHWAWDELQSIWTNTLTGDTRDA